MSGRAKGSGAWAGGWPPAKKVGKGSGSENVNSGGGGGGGGETVLTSGYNSDRILEGCGMGVGIDTGVLSASVLVHAELARASASCNMRTQS